MTYLIWNLKSLSIYRISKCLSSNQILNNLCASKACGKNNSSSNSNSELRIRTLHSANNLIKASNSSSIILATKPKFLQSNRQIDRFLLSQDLPTPNHVVMQIIVKQLRIFISILSKRINTQISKKKRPK